MDTILRRLGLATLVLVSLATPGEAQAAATTNDQAVLAADLLFENRGLESFIGICVSTVITEAETVAKHRQRVSFCQIVMGTATGPSAFKVNIAEVAAANATVIGDATQGGTVALTGPGGGTGNVDAQEALVTDTDLSNAIAAGFNIFVGNAP